METLILVLFTFIMTTYMVICGIKTNREQSSTSTADSETEQNIAQSSTPVYQKPEQPDYDAGDEEPAPY